MPYKAILREAKALEVVSGRIELLAVQNPPLSDDLLAVAEGVRSQAFTLAVLVAAQGLGPAVT